MKYLLTNGKLVQMLNYDGSRHKLVIPSSGESGYKPTKFSAFRLVITKIGSGSTLQFSRLKFISADGTEFNYCKNETPTITNIVNYIQASANRGSHGSSGEDPEAGLLLETQKCCFVGAYPTESNPVIFTYRFLQNRTLDISIYNKWYWWSSNDTWNMSGSGARHLVSFKLQVSNYPDDENSWYTLDSQANCIPLQKINQTKAYQGNLVFPDIETQI